MEIVNVHYFALLREMAGLDSEVVKLNCTTYKELFQQLADKYGFNIPSEMIQVAVDDEFSSMEKTIIPGAKVVFIPPVAGG